jgi:hypothetical protein
LHETCKAKSDGLHSKTGFSYIKKIKSLGENLPVD